MEKITLKSVKPTENIKNVFLKKEVFTKQEWLLDIVPQIDAQISTLYDCKINNKHCCYLVVRVERLEVVLVGIVGSYALVICNFFLAQCKKIGLQSVRFHSKRKGAEKYASILGMKKIETVYGKSI